MKFVILGTTALYVDGKQVGLGAAKQRGLLALLLYRVNEPVRVDTIVEHLWPGRRERDCRDGLYALASRIRAVLRGVGVRDALTRVPSIGGYRLDVDPELVDYHRFRRAVSQAREAAARHEHGAAAALLQDVLPLWTDEPLADLRSAGTEHLRRNMTEVLLDAHKLLAASRMRAGHHHAVLAQLEPLLPEHDCDEMLAERWVGALCAAGREDDARAYAIAFRRRFRAVMRTEPALQLPGTARARRTHDDPAPARLPQPTAAPRQLPNDIGDFTGREDLLAELDALTTTDAGGAKVVVLAGMPGSGKTTLAIHWAHRHRDRFPDGQLYLPANAHGPGPPLDLDEATGRLLGALEPGGHPAPAGDGQRAELLNRLVANRRLLIVLDDVRDSGQARPLLPTAETCVMLITSRNRLRGLSIRDGVHSLAIAPLTHDDSAALLTRVIGAARAEQEPAALHALARLSGGLPLALRIIGVHVAERPRARLADLVDELSGGLLDCTGEDDEEANLRSVFAWSYNALTPPAARLFRILGLHPGPSISVGAAAALSGGAVPVTQQLLDTLAKAHLVNHDTARRYRFHDLVRLYAGDQAHREEPAGRQRAALHRMLDWYLLSAVNAARALDPQRPPVPDLPTAATVEPLTFGTESRALEWCEAERGNLAALTRWCAVNGFPRHGWQIPGTVHEALERHGPRHDLLELHQTALSCARDDQHLLGQVGTLNNLGAVYFARHDYRRAIRSVETALGLARDGHLREMEIASTHNLASLHLNTGDTATAIRLYHEVLAACRADGFLPGEASTLHFLGKAYRLSRRYEQAIAHYHQALTIRQRVGLVRGHGETLAELARLHLDNGRPTEALDHARRALDLADRAKDEAARCDALITVADAARELARYPEAIDAAQEAILISEGNTDAYQHCHALAVLADTLRCSGSTAAAHRISQEALGSVAESGSPHRDRLLAIRDATAPG